MKLKLLTISAATAALLATGVIAQDRPATDPATPPAVTQTPKATTTTTTKTTTEAIQFATGVGANQMLVSELTGTDVRNAAGEALGDISDIVVDGSGQPAVAIIGVGGFLGLGEKNIGVPFAALTFTQDNSNIRVARLDTTKDALQAAPSFVYADAKAVSQPVKTQ
ncbi:MULTISPECIES: PRC-barrel domain-containing protein [Rhodomicrobium]|uniref:PRC-barrel domain-containing protein n=1 Tax=Rhodomicrobium TaxID=1068 RepID=UPI000B4C1D04|nr:MULTISPECIES: PRC-barrel domain-containing protein [Rhodomicrobium]